MGATSICGALVIYRQAYSMLSPRRRIGGMLRLFYVARASALIRDESREYLRESDTFV